MRIPKGFTTVTPCFCVDGAETFAAFLKSAFGGVEIGRSLRADGRIANVQVRIGTSTVMASEASGKYPAMHAAYYLYVEDAGKTMEQALRSGAKLEMEVGDMPYGDRQGGVVDPCGNIWWISQRLVDEAYFE
ncbi:MAG: VOC family protein [Proteobacteria bacterium]|uniref:VOC family protein n=1 Tax=Rudaea sp. TaxID=2136325 RepID=UPI00321FFAA9|nr:VOC family protein [Pseudomonadota bacterium]